MRLHPLLRYSFLLLPVLCICLPSNKLYAGQVVTKNLRQWAQEAVARESALEAGTAANTLAILYFDNQTRRPELDPLQKGLTVMLITDLSKIESIQVVERARLQALLEELDLGVSGLVDETTAPRVGRLVGAAYLVGGHLDAANDSTIQINSDLISVARRELLGEPASKGSLEELLRMEKEIAFEIVRLLGLELTPEQAEELRKPLTTDLNALMLWFQGISLGDQRRYAEAADAYRKAIQSDPAFQAAEGALEELRRLKLVSRLPDTMQVLERLHQRVSVNDRPEPDEITKHERTGEVQTSNVTVRWR